jgi:rubrerythrin
MDQNKFQEMIRFAIEREKASVDFYILASHIAKYSGTKQLFLDFSKQEEGHRKLLESMTKEKIVEAKIENIPNLKISDYLADTELKSDSSYADILRVAMKREEHSIRLYNDLKEPNGDEALMKF